MGKRGAAVFILLVAACYRSPPGSNWTEAFAFLPAVASPVVGCDALLSPESLLAISLGGVAVERAWLPPGLTRALKADAKDLYEKGEFRADGLTNTALGEKQGFSAKADRQTFRGGAGWDSNVGNGTARAEFAEVMARLRSELAVGLDRPTLAPEGTRKHEMTYNRYEPGAKLGRHIDEHHEETKGVRGWQLPTRRSVTWLLYLNDGWTAEEGGALRCFPRQHEYEGARVSRQVGAHNGNLQVGWLDGTDPVFLDCWRPSGMAALYRVPVTTNNNNNNKSDEAIELLSTKDFEVPRQPLHFDAFLDTKHQKSFEQISTPRLDPRFANEGAAVTPPQPNLNPTGAILGSQGAEEKHALDVIPEGGTLVLFDSVTLPHLVLEVTGTRQRIAATGWFHEESQYHFGQELT